LEGCWTGDIVECWERTDTGYIGAAQSIGPLEHMTLVFTDGQVAYVARPPGQKKATFLLTESEGTHALFENPQHDFPTRLDYRRSEDTLTVRVEGADQQGFTLTLQRSEHLSLDQLSSR
jgi:hypothetical protein